jgi:hypothetical protein
VSYMPLAHRGIKLFHAWHAAIGHESWTRSILVTNSASLSKASRPLTNLSGFKFQLDAVEAQRHPLHTEMVRHDVFEYARQIGNADLLRMLEAAARLRYSPATHGRFPRPARYAAAELLRLGYQVGSGVLVPVWAEHVIPFLVSRTSRGAVPTLPQSVVFIDALSDDEVGAMLEGDYAEHATLEVERRAVERLVRSC